MRTLQRSSWPSRVLAGGLLSSVALFCASRNAQAQEFMDELERMTGLESKLIEKAQQLLREPHPGFDFVAEQMDDFNTSLRYLRALNDFYKGERLAAVAGNAIWDELKEHLKDRALKYLGQTFSGVVSTIEIYQAALELLNDLWIKPGIHRGIYQTYRTHRDGGADPEQAYTIATGAWSGQACVKQDVFDNLIADRGYSKKLVGEMDETRLARALRAKIDDFWKKSLEQEYLAEKRFIEQKAVLAANPDLFHDMLRAQYEKPILALKIAASTTKPGDLTIFLSDRLSQEPVQGKGCVRLLPLLGPPEPHVAELAGGVAQFRNIPGGQFAATAEVEGFVPRQGTITFLTVEKTRQERKGYLEPLVALEVVVNQAMGDPIAGAEVSLRMEREGKLLGQLQGRTGADGTVLFRNLPEGTATFAVRKAGFKDESGGRMLSPGRMRCVTETVYLAPIATARPPGIAPDGDGHPPTNTATAGRLPPDAKTGTANTTPAAKDPPAATGRTEPDYAAMGAQLNAIYIKYQAEQDAKAGCAGKFQVEFQRGWVWVPARRQFEADICLWHVAPTRNDDPKTFRKHREIVRLGAVLSLGSARKVIASGNWTDQ